MMELDTQPGSLAPQKNAPQSHPFPYIFENICNRKKYNKDLKTFPKLAFHVQVMKDRSIRARHFMNKKNKTLEQCPGLVCGFF